MSDPKTERLAARLLEIAMEAAAEVIAKNSDRRDEILKRLEAYQPIVPVRN